MTQEKITLEMRGIPRNYFVEYFNEIVCTQLGNSRYKGIGWEVEIDDEHYCFLGSIKISVTKIFITGEEEHCQNLIVKFNRKFLRVGG